MKKLLLSLFVFRVLTSFSQIVTDYDGNEYNTIHIGNQDWLKENLRSTHYSDGNEAAYMRYNDSDEGVEEYGLLYTWDAAMHDSTEEGVQGICPCGWHVPGRQDWNDLFAYLGGATVAGRHLKEAGNDHWNLPNTGDNSTGFTATGAGFYNSDPLYTIGYQQRGNILGLWTSTPSAVAGRAVQFAIQNSSDDVGLHGWVRTDAYSIRCIRDGSGPDGVDENTAGDREFTLFPNPVEAGNMVHLNAGIDKITEVNIYDGTGRMTGVVYNPSENSIMIPGLNSGIYLVTIKTLSGINFSKMVVL